MIRSTTSLWIIKEITGYKKSLRSYVQLVGACALHGRNVRKTGPGHSWLSEFESCKMTYVADWRLGLWYTDRRRNICNWRYSCRLWWGRASMIGWVGRLKVSWKRVLGGPPRIVSMEGWLKRHNLSGVRDGRWASRSLFAKENSSKKLFIKKISKPHTFNKIKLRTTGVKKGLEEKCRQYSKLHLS